MIGFSARIEQYRIGFLGLFLLILSSIFILGGPKDVPSQTWGIIFLSLIAPYLLLAALFRSFVRAAAPALGVVASLVVVHAVSSVTTFSPRSVEALFLITLLATGGMAARASVAIMTNVAKFGRCDPYALPVQEIAAYGFAAFLAGVVATGDFSFVMDHSITEGISFLLVALAAPLFGFSLFFFLVMDKQPAGEDAVAHHNRLLQRAGAFESIGKAAETRREGRGLLLFVIPLLGLVVVVYTGADAFQGQAGDMLLLIGGLTGVALFACKSVRSALVIGLSISVYTALLGFAASTWALSGQSGETVFASLGVASAIMLPPSTFLYKLCEYHLLKGAAMRTVLMTSAVRGVAMFMLTSGLFILGAIPWIVLGSRDAAMFASLLAAFLTLGALFIPLFGLSLFATVEGLFPRRVLIKRTV